MSRTKGTLGLSSNIEPSMNAPLDGREVTGTKTDLTSTSAFPYFYEGMTVYVKDEQKSYQLKGADPTDASNWVEVGSDAYDDTAIKQRVSDIEDVIPNDATEQNQLATADDIPDVSNFITNAVNDLLNYYLKSETYTKTEVNQLIAALSGIQFEVVATLPTENIKTNVIYLVPSEDPQTSNVKDEYINLDGTSAGWEIIGSTDIDLSGYVTTQALNTALADYTTTTNLTTMLAAKADASTVSAILDGASIDSFADVESALADKVSKSSTAGLLKNDGTVDESQYLTQTDVDNKANKVANATTGHFASLTATGDIQDSGKGESDFLTQHQDITGKADKVANATTDNFAALDANGNLKDSGIGAGDLVSDIEDLSDIDITTPADGDSLIYDETNQKWVNGRGAGGSDIQVKTMPEATLDNMGQIVQFVGDTTADYVNGKFYKSTAEDYSIKDPVAANISYELQGGTAGWTIANTTAAFDGNDSTYASFKLPHNVSGATWALMAYDTELHVYPLQAKIKLYIYSGNVNLALNISVQGSNGSEWTTLASEALPAHDYNVDYSYDKTLTIPQGENTYSKYRLYISDTTSGTTMKDIYIYTFDIIGYSDYYWGQIPAYTIKDSSDESYPVRNNLKFSGDLEVSDDSENDETEVAPHRLTSEELADICSPLPAGTANLPVLFDESGAEYVVGRYVNSQGKWKPMYQKIVNMTSPSSKGVFTISELPNIDTLTNIDGYMKPSNGWRARINSWQTSSSYTFINFNGNTQQFYFSSDSNEYLSCSMCLILQYTKSTDTYQD